ncbi:MAG: TrkA family potassium uptake protein [Halanaeroarchaeum sp.]
MTPDLSVIVAGGGRVGFQTAQLLADRGHDVTIVERDPGVVSTLADEWVATVIHGDATDPETIEQAGLDRADVVAGLTGETGVNLAVCLLAQELGGEIRTVARIDHPGARSYERLVDAAVFPESAGARTAADAIGGGAVQTLANVTGSLDVMSIRVAEGAPGAGKTLEDVRLPAGSLVVSAADGETVARPETTLVPGRRYVVAVEPAVADEVLNLFRG